MFDREIAQWFDVAHPRWLNFPTFILMGLAYSTSGKEIQVFDQRLEELFIGVAFRAANGVILPVGPLLRDISQASNSLGSFLGGNYSEKFTHLIGEDRASTLDSKAYQTLAGQALDILTENPNDLSAWLILQVTISNLPAPDSLVDKLSQILTQTQFVNLINQDKELTLAVMEFATMQSVHLMNEDLNQHLRTQFLQVVEQLAQQAWEKSNFKISDLDFLYLRPVEIALNLAICSPTMNEKILLFRDLLSQIVEIWPMTIPIIKPIVQILCEELPVKQGQHFGALLLRLRTE